MNIQIYLNLQVQHNSYNSKDINHNIFFHILHLMVFNYMRLIIINQHFSMVLMQLYMCNNNKSIDLIN